MATREEVEARIEQKRLDRAAEAKRIHDEEYVTQVAPLIEDSDDMVAVEIADAPANLPGWAVFRAPNKGEHLRFTQAVWRGEGHEEAKAKAGAAMAVSCRVYPDTERLNELFTKRTGVGALCGSAVLKLATAGAEKQEKK